MALGQGHPDAGDDQPQAVGRDEREAVTDRAAERSRILGGATAVEPRRESDHMGGSGAADDGQALAVITARTRCEQSQRGGGRFGDQHHALTDQAGAVGGGVLHLRREFLALAEDMCSRSSTPSEFSPEEISPTPGEWWNRI